MNAPGTRTAGVLALQGDFAPHAEALCRVGAEPHLVRTPEDLAGLTHLVLPGGESTTLARLLVLFGLEEELVRRSRAGELVLFGTCAGAILLARLGLLDVDVERNAYGAQLDSFARPVVLMEPCDCELAAVFIRAPRITRVGPGVRALGTLDGDPVLVEGPGVLAATFHPELTTDPFLHERFLALAPSARPTAVTHS